MRTDLGRSVFCAHALPYLWAEAPRDQRLRPAVARLAQHLHHSTVRRLFTGSFEVRDQLGDDFHRLRHLALRIAQQRPHEYIRGEGDEPAAARARTDLAAHVEAFIDGTLDPTVLRWASLSVPNTEARDPRDRGLDPEYLYAANAWIPSLRQARDDTKDSTTG